MQWLFIFCDFEQNCSNQKPNSPSYLVVILRLSSADHKTIFGRLFRINDYRREALDQLSLMVLVFSIFRMGFFVLDHIGYFVLVCCTSDIIETWCWRKSNYWRIHQTSDGTHGLCLLRTTIFVFRIFRIPKDLSTFFSIYFQSFFPTRSKDTLHWMDPDGSGSCSQR